MVIPPERCTPEAIEAAMDDVHDMDVTLREYALAVSKMIMEGVDIENGASANDDSGRVVSVNCGGSASTGNQKEDDRCSSKPGKY